MNGYNNYHKSPEAGQAVPPSIQRRLRVTDMALRFAVAATYMQHSAEQARLQRETEARPAVGKIGVSQIINNNAEPVHVESVTTPTPATETPAPTINNVPKTTPVAIEGQLVTDADDRLRDARRVLDQVLNNEGQDYGIAA